MTPAEIVFVESPSGNFWTARFLAPREHVVDVQGGISRPHAVDPYWSCTIRIVTTGPRRTAFELARRGGPRGSERYSLHDTVTDAQNVALAWARRRYRVVGG